MKALWSRLPGPAPVKALQILILAVVGLVALFFLFEWAGGLLDSGGVIGP